MKKPIPSVLILLSLVVLSCSPTYVPNVRNAALFRGAGEFQGSLHFGQGVDAQAAASLTDHLGVMTNFEFVSRNTSASDNDDHDNYIKHNFWEGAVGYFENSEKICYEIFGGFGKGKGTAYNNYSAFGPDEVKATGTYSRLFIQPSVGSNHRTFNWIVSARISFVDFDKISDTAHPFSINPDPVLFIEPAFTGRVFFWKRSPLLPVPGRIYLYFTRRNSI